MARQSSLKIAFSAAGVNVISPLEGKTAKCTDPNLTRSFEINHYLIAVRLRLAAHNPLKYNENSRKL